VFIVFLDSVETRYRRIQTAASGGLNRVVQDAKCVQYLLAFSCGDGLHDLVSAFAHQRIKLLSRTAARGGDANHGCATVVMGATNALNKPAGFEFFKHA